jgi:hypothetical protein
MMGGRKEGREDGRMAADDASPIADCAAHRMVSSSE